MPPLSSTIFFTPSIYILQAPWFPWKYCEPIINLNNFALSTDGWLTSAFAMNSMAVMVASGVASSPGKRSLINLIDSSMCFLCTIISCNPKSADVHKRAWKSAASVMISGNHAESMALLSVGNMAPASTQSNLNLACGYESKSGEKRGNLYAQSWTSLSI
jgi:hypothetical protein